MVSRSLLSLAAIAALVFIASCGPSVDLTHAGFASQAALDNADRTVIAESVGGSMDPTKLAPEGRYAHNGVHYSTAEEGYYRWGQKLYHMGYRDVVYVKELAPKAFRRKLMDIYEAAYLAGFREADDQQ